MQTALIAAISGVTGAILGAFGLILAARYGWVAKKYELDLHALRDVKKCQDECFELKNELNTVYLVVNYLVKLVPNADKEIKDMLKGIAERRRLHKAEAEGE